MLKMIAILQIPGQVFFIYSQIPNLYCAVRCSPYEKQPEVRESGEMARTADSHISSKLIREIRGPISLMIQLVLSSSPHFHGSPIVSFTTIR